MITVKQTYSRHEDGYGEVTVVFVISDKFNGIFEGSNAHIDSSGLSGSYSTGYTIGAKAITGITQASECVFTIVDHGFANGDIVFIEGHVDTAWDACFKNQYFVIGDVTDDTFTILNGDIEVDLFNIGDVTKKISDKIGGMVTSSLEFTINEYNIQDKTDRDVVDFVADALDPTKFRYCGHFFDPVMTTRLQSESRFLGIIKPSISDEALAWKSQQWASVTGGIWEHKFSAESLASDLFDSIMLKDLILGSEDDTVPGIDATWEGANVADRQGWFSRNVYNSGNNLEYNDHTMVYQLVNFNAVLRKLADNLVTALTNKDLGTYSIIFDRSELDGEWLPTRWSHYRKRVKGQWKFPRFVSWSGDENLDAVDAIPLSVYADDAQVLAINPDGNNSDFTGSGLDDISVSGEYTAKTRVTIRIQIDSTGSPDTYKWSIDDGSNWNVGYSCSTTYTEILSGISIKFGAVTGHSIGDYWEISPATKYESIWINYNIVKLNSNNETKSDSAKSFVFSEMEDVSFTEFISGIAINFGLFAEFYYTDAVTLHIKFINRQNFNGVQCYIRDAEKCSKKLTGEIQSDEKYYGYSSYLTYEGSVLPGYDMSYHFYYYNVYYKYRNSSGGIIVDKGLLSINDSNKLWLTISPTTAIVWDEQSDGSFDEVSDDKGCWVMRPHFPHGHYAERTKAGESPEKTNDFYLNLYGLTTAIFLYVDKRTDLVFGGTTDTCADEPSQYWTPAAYMIAKIDGIEKGFERLSDYINLLRGRENGYFQSEITIDVPMWCGFSSNADGTNPGWHNLELGKIVVLDGISYTITSIKYNGEECSTSLTLQGSGRFADIESPLVPMIKQITGPEIGTRTLPVADGQIYTLNVIKQNADNTLSAAVRDTSEHGLIKGICLFDITTGGGVDYVNGGIIENNDWEDIIGQTITPGDILTLKSATTGTDNIELNGQFVSGQLWCRIGIFESKTRLRIDIREIMVG